MDACFALIHSPLVGPLTWQPVTDVLRRRGIDAVVPTLKDAGHAEPYWQQHADSAARALANIPIDRPLVFVGHSGAGTLLPHIRQWLPHPIAAYLFVDAGLPLNGMSRLGEMEASGSEFGAQLRRDLEAGRRYPEWTEAMLRPIIPDDNLRRGMVRELQPRGLDFFTEPFPPLSGWPDAPCACVHFTASYDRAIAEAQRHGWPVRAFKNASHFHMLVDPEGVTDALIALSPIAE